jgi:hypothetical protein
MERLKTYKITYTAWHDGARMPVRGEFIIAAESERDAIGACALRWPEMMVDSVSEIGGNCPEIPDSSS